MKYKKSINGSIDIDYQYYLGKENIFGVMFGHFTSSSKEGRKATYIWKKLLQQYYTKNGKKNYK